MKKNYPLYKVERFYDFKEMMDIAVRETPDRAALRYKSRGTVKDVTYAELERRTDALGSALASLGYKDCHFAILSENSYKWILTYIMILKGEGVVVPIDKELSDDEAVNLINMGDAKVLFFSNAKKKNVEQNRDRLKGVELFVNLDDHADGEWYRSLYRLTEQGDVLVNAGYSDYLNASNRRDDLKMIVFTSGTTGVAKGVMLSLRNMTSMVYYGLQMITVFTVGLSVLPYHHTYEAICDILPSLHKHCTICVNENLRAVSENLKLYKPDYIMLVPVFVEFFYNAIWKKAEKAASTPAAKEAEKPVVPEKRPEASATLKDVPICTMSYMAALQSSKEQEWRNSQRASKACVKYINDNLHNFYEARDLNTMVKNIEEQFGLKRALYTIAATIQLKEQDGRFSQSAKDRAKEFPFDSDRARLEFLTEAHPVMLCFLYEKLMDREKELSLPAPEIA